MFDDMQWLSFLMKATDPMIIVTATENRGCPVACELLVMLFPGMNYAI